MKNFKVTVNGKTYEVEVEEIGGAVAPPTVTRQAPASSAPPPRPAAAAPAPKAKPKAAAPDKAADGSGTPIPSPMPGNILSVNIKAGDSVTKGQVLLILEAMKMENEIMAAGDGKVTSVNVAKGATVSAGDILLVVQFS
ncbi:MAG: biotin/lipoyl-containing protein [Candidatus Auribacterota bacterium]|nr:biotin/lipoyl-containing protein [Candidatus Auribacterota bacterium]